MKRHDSQLSAALELAVACGYAPPAGPDTPPAPPPSRRAYLAARVRAASTADPSPPRARNVVSQPLTPEQLQRHWDEAHSRLVKHSDLMRGGWRVDGIQVM